MNLTEQIRAFLNAQTKPTETENTYTSPKRLKIARTVYPNGKKQMSLDGKCEWYGLSYVSNFGKR